MKGGDMAELILRNQDGPVRVLRKRWLNSSKRWALKHFRFPQSLFFVDWLRLTDDFG